MSDETPAAQATFQLDDGCAQIVLNRPAQLNAMTPQMVAEMMAGLAEARSGGARVLLVRAEGRGFSAGRDLGESQPGEEDGGEVLRDLFNPMVRAVADLPFPTVAAVQGACLGTGLGLALACDVVIAADNAKFGSPFANIGCVLDSGGHRAFVQRLGPARALDLIYSGRFLSGVEAAAAGLVSRSVPLDDLTSTALDYARTLAAGPALAFAESKRLVRTISESATTLDQVLDLEAEAQSRSSHTKDYVEGFTAFLEKRRPAFTGE